LSLLTMRTPIRVRYGGPDLDFMGHFARSYMWAALWAKPQRGQKGGHSA
jgi:hypothetical protein